MKANLFFKFPNGLDENTSMDFEFTEDFKTEVISPVDGIEKETLFFKGSKITGFPATVKIVKDQGIESMPLESVVVKDNIADNAYFIIPTDYLSPVKTNLPDTISPRPSSEKKYFGFSPKQLLLIAGLSFITFKLFGNAK